MATPSIDPPPMRILFVCTGNICRSPTAEGVARAIAEREGLASRFEFDSAGIQGFHIGENPDARTVAAARRRGYDLSRLKARRVSEFDFVNFEHILAMDFGHLAALRRACPTQHAGKLGMFLAAGGVTEDEEVPDPYYGGPQGFEAVLDMVELAARGLILRLAVR